jgi:hypothetical protein
MGLFGGFWRGAGENRGLGSGRGGLVGLFGNARVAALDWGLAIGRGCERAGGV